MLHKVFHIFVFLLIFAVSAFAMETEEATEGPKLVAFTFDDGPNLIATPKILDICEKYNIPVTFFVVGRQVKEKTIPVMKRAVDLGCEIENHTWSHPFMTRRTPEQRKIEIEKTNEAIYKAVGRKPIFFRPPFIDYNRQMLEEIDMYFMAGAGSDDYIVSHSPKMIVDTVMKKVRDGSIFVMHDLLTNKRTPIAFETIVQELQHQGYKFVTVEQMFQERGTTLKKKRLYTNAYLPKKKKQKVAKPPKEKKVKEKKIKEPRPAVVKKRSRKKKKDAEEDA